MENKTVLSVFGTRPEAIKMAPLVKTLEASGSINSLVCVTAQHREILDQVLSVFDIHPDFDLNIMKKTQSLSSVSSDVLNGVNCVIRDLSPDMVLVHGDTTTAFASALAAFYEQIPVGHVEAGLRTHDIYSPFPEEMNRSLIGRIAQLHFAPTKSNAEALRAEMVGGDIVVTGNTVIDALNYTVKDDYCFHDELLQKLNYDENNRTILLTAHRRENIGIRMENICDAVIEICKAQSDVRFICPVHPNPAVRNLIFNKLGNEKQVLLVDPLDVSDFHNLMARCSLVLTDSGGLQEEAPALGKPVVVLRDTTERQEAIEAGTVIMGGIEKEQILQCSLRLLTDDVCYKRMAKAVNPYGDGRASARILRSIKEYFGEDGQEENKHGHA